MRDLKKTGHIQGTLQARMGTIKNINGKVLTEAEETYATNLSDFRGHGA